MVKSGLNTFEGGMQKDLADRLLPSNKYRDAQNLRLITTKGGTTGNLENIKGNKLILDAGYGAEDIVDGKIMGGVELRDSIILFVTENQSNDPVSEGLPSRLYRMTMDLPSETQTTLELLYDDSMSVDSSKLNWSTYYPIKAIAKYETPNVQKVYFTDGYNNMRYVNVATYLTVDGTEHVGTDSDFMSVDKFDYLPKFIFNKPTLKNIVGGKVNTGMVAYAYQLYIMNGAETAFSALSDPISVVSDNDFLTNTKSYKGDELVVNSGKGFVMEIDNTDNIGYNRLRLVRVQYSYLNSVPEIYICNEIAISPAGGTINVTDVGDVLGTLTVDEFNLVSTELFTCQDIASKDNRLFVANIEKKEFVVDDWDARAIRFRVGTGHQTIGTYTQGLITEITSTITESDSNKITCELTGLAEMFGIEAPDTLDDINSVSTTLSAGSYVYGHYYNGDGDRLPFSCLYNDCTINISSYAADTVIFTITKNSGDFFTDFDYIDGCRLANTYFNYDWTYQGADAVATLLDSVEAPITITSDLSNWEDDYVPSYDGINTFNDTDNDGDAAHAFIYQTNGSTIGAEGPNISIDFETSSVIIDTSNNDTTFYTAPKVNGDDISYDSYASPWKGGKLSWQRDEVYRLFVVFGNDRGQVSDPKWIIDLRMPSLHDDDFTNSEGNDCFPSNLSVNSAGVINTTRLYPRIFFKSFPTNATWAQIHRVKRERVDRSVVTQGLALTSSDYLSNGIDYRPMVTDATMNDYAAEAPIKLISPEINILKNISPLANDYIENVTDYTGNYSKYEHDYATVGDIVYQGIYKAKTNNKVTYTSDTRADIVDSLAISPAIDTNEYVTVDNKRYHNNFDNIKGCSGLLIKHDNTTWDANGSKLVVVNYKSKVYGSQYGGHTYEDRMNNISIPCSDIISKDSAWHDILYGDTFINFFDASVYLTDLTLNYAVYSESVYIPLESSINCDLRFDKSSSHVTYNDYNALLRQEYSGEFELPEREHPKIKYTQTENLYSYNTVYSQQIDIKPAISLVVDKILETKFDTMVKSSNKKSNGEITDSWTKFGVNEYIEVDSIHGPVQSLFNFNNKLFYFQDKAFGVLSVNDRSVIQDTTSAKLVLGTGGVLDRYDYVSILCGSKDKFSIVGGDTGMFWFDRVNNYLIKYADSIDKISISKGMQSYLTTSVASDHKVIAVADKNNNEVLYTFYDSGTADAFTLAYSENIDAFISFYTVIPNIYIPYKNRYLTTTATGYCNGEFDMDLIYLHDSDIIDRCNFYSKPSDTQWFSTSTLKILFNQDYNYTKAWDNLFYISNVFNSNGVELYNQSLSSARCYNDYQNSDFVDLTYGTNLMRRERGWTIDVPRNVVKVDHTTDPNIFTSDLTDTDRLYRERLRDKYMIADLVYINDDTKDRFVLHNFGVKYRSSSR